ncbi:hypothetical protein [Devosia faecipullorum]|uniref:hypothetical protein n=1 Tax=Devosia faecipullorum TaxID=2755039 RepID=UPI00187B7756|nr:hypothetical protein [Devosia faecipullorum]MBE7731549.1 hypothetical protein [Devosia faecipullorum]
MKLTWFGNSAFRIHGGGQIVVVDADSAPQIVAVSELVSGADHVIALDGAGEVTDLATWKPRARLRLVDGGDEVRPVQIWRAGDKCLLIEPDEDMPLLLVAGPVPELGRWVEKAVVVLLGQDLAARGEQLVARAIPGLIALAGADGEVEAAFARLPPKLDGAGLIALEPGMAVEV